MVSTTCADHRAALDGDCRRPTTASWLACRALSAFCLTVAVSSSIEEAVSSSELACSSVRGDRSGLPAAIWLGGGGDGVGAVAHLADDADQAVVHVLQGVQQLRRSRPSPSTSMWLRQVAGGDGLRHFHGLAQRARDRARDPVREEPAHQHVKQAQPDLRLRVETMRSFPSAARWLQLSFSPSNKFLNAVLNRIQCGERFLD